MIWLSFWLGFLSAFLASAAVLAVVLWYEWRQDAKWSKVAAPLQGAYVISRARYQALRIRAENAWRN